MPCNIQAYAEIPFRQDCSLLHPTIYQYNLVPAVRLLLDVAPCRRRSHMERPTGRCHLSTISAHLQKMTKTASVRFLARDSIQHNAQRAICYRPSVCLSVTRVDQTTTVEIRIMKFLPYSSPIPRLQGKFHPEILRGSFSGRVKQGRGGETSYFLALYVNVSKTVRDILPKLLHRVRKKRPP